MPRPGGRPRTQEDLMCPLCIATGSVLLTGAGSTGGLTAVAAKLLRMRRAKRRLAAIQSLETAPSAAARADFPHPSSEFAPK